MKPFIKDVYVTLFNDRGILHLIGIFCLVYLLTYWGNSHYAQSTPLFPSSMMASLVRQHLALQAFMFTFFGFVIGYLIEWFQGVYFLAKSQWSDVIWTTFGAPFGWVAYKFFGENDLLFSISVITIGILIFYIGKTFYQKIKSSR